MTFNKGCNTSLLFLICSIDYVIGDELLFEARKWIDVFKDLTMKVSPRGYYVIGGRD